MSLTGRILLRKRAIVECAIGYPATISRIMHSTHRCGTHTLACLKDNLPDLSRWASKTIVWNGDSGWQTSQT